MRLLLLLALLPIAMAVPGIPSDFYGTVTIDGAPAPAGTVVDAYIGAELFAQFTVTTAGSYGLMPVTGDDPDTSGKEGGVNGESVTFRVDNAIVSQTGTWAQGQSVEVNLVRGSRSPDSSSSSTSTPEPVLISEPPEPTLYEEPEVPDEETEPIVETDNPPTEIENTAETTEVGETQETDLPKKTEAETKSYIGIIIGVILALAIIITIVILFIRRN